MKIDFHSHILGDCSLEDALIAHKHLSDYHFNLLEKRSKCEFFFLKIAAGFFVAIAVAFMLQDRGLISNAFILIFSTGIGCLFFLAMNAKKDLEFGARAAECVRKGIIIEKRQDLDVRVFQIFEDNKSLSYRGNLFSRLFPFWVIGVATVIAGVFLSIKIGLSLTIVVSLFSLSALLLISLFYIKISRKILLKSNS